jgi:type VI secretion system protein ImpE
MGQSNQLIDRRSPMEALEQLRFGDLASAMAMLKQDVRKAPRDPRLRTFLFQMFCITGEWDRALTQLTVAAELDPLALPMSQTYQTAIRCEVLREKVFRGERYPTVLGDPGSWLPLLIQAVALLATSQADEAASLRETAFEAAPETACELNGTPCAWIADADPRLGPVLEVFVNGNYMWVPFERLRALKLDPPTDLRDQIWMPAHFTWDNNGEADGFIPTRYPGSATASDPALALSRKTEWHDAAADWSVPLGQRVLVTDINEMALMDIRDLSITPALAGSGQCPA